MQNKVVHTAARAMQEAGAATVRFNFRGVGASGGQLRQGRRRTRGCVGRDANGPAPTSVATRCGSAGFSFGAAVALQAAARQARPRRLVTIAPPVGRIITEPVARPDCPWLIVQGDRDELVDADAVQAWAASYEPAPQVLVIDGAEHFFHGKLRRTARRDPRFLRRR